MIYVQSNLLKFDVVDLISCKFPKSCVIDFESVIPIKSNGDIIGFTDEIVLGDKAINMKGHIDCNPEIENAVCSLIKTGQVHGRGYYRLNEQHVEDGIRVIDKVELLHINLFLDDVYGDNFTLLQLSNVEDCTSKEVKKND